MFILVSITRIYSHLRLVAKKQGDPRGFLRARVRVWYFFEGYQYGLLLKRVRSSYLEDFPTGSHQTASSATDRRHATTRLGHHQFFDKI